MNHSIQHITEKIAIRKIIRFLLYCIKLNHKRSPSIYIRNRYPYLPHHRLIWISLQKIQIVTKEESNLHHNTLRLTLKTRDIQLDSNQYIFFDKNNHVYTFLPLTMFNIFKTSTIQFIITLELYDTIKKEYYPLTTYLYPSISAMTSSIEYDTTHDTKKIQLAIQPSHKRLNKYKLSYLKKIYINLNLTYVIPTPLYIQQHIVT